MRHIELPPVMDGQAVARLAPLLRAAMDAGEAVTLHGGGVVQIGQAGLQMLLTAARSAEVRLEAPSESLAGMAALAGLQSLPPFVPVQGAAA